MSSYGCKAVIFDLDGVITQTALVHSAAWKQVFDDYLREREDRDGELFKEFTHERDYLSFVDGKPRYQGVQSFLESRGVSIPFGSPEDGPDQETACGIGNRKNAAFNQILRRDGVKVFDSTVALMRKLRGLGIRVGVASSSKNCKAILEVAGISDLAETRVCGLRLAELGLKGKPDPDMFTTACALLDCKPSESVVVEDAVSGVQAGRNGSFALVLGIARENNAAELLANGADIVVSDLSEITLTDIEAWLTNELPKRMWSLNYADYDAAKERTRESLMTVGNGYMCTRGAMEEVSASDTNYPATYMAGVYNRLTSKVADRDLENEDLVNVVQWLPVTFRIDDGAWFDPNADEFSIQTCDRNLDFRSGVLQRLLEVQDSQGRRTRIESRRVLSMDNPHLAALEYTVTPLNYAGRIALRSELRGDHINDGVARYRQLNQQHLKPVAQDVAGNLSSVSVITTQSQINIAASARLSCAIDGVEQEAQVSGSAANGRSICEVEFELAQTTSLTLHKIAAVYTSRDTDSSDPLRDSAAALQHCGNFDEIVTASQTAWQRIWERVDIELQGDRFAQMLLRLHLFHSFATASPHTVGLDVGIGARGLHGEAYRGHIFWDELYILPFFNLHFPEITAEALMYRYRRLDAARAYAKEHGYAGAMYPWQSGSDGREETQVLHLNPLSGKWGPDHSSLQRHVSLAIAYNIWQYLWTTDDLAFMEKCGAEMFMEICRFWISACTLNKDTGRFSIDRVMGPDEFHEKYPGAAEGGLRDNSYINILTAWTLQRAADIFDRLSPDARTSLERKIGLTKAEIDSWQETAGALNIVLNEDGILAQYDGYFELEELDWDYYRQKYGNIYRMDRLLKAEGQSPDSYKVAKQADVLMTFYLLQAREVESLLARLGYQLPSDYLARNFEYYLQRTSHGSTLSRLVHAVVAGSLDRAELSWDLYRQALVSDYNDIQGGTSAEGIHMGVMTGTVWAALSAYAGLNLSTQTVSFSPRLPANWDSLSFCFAFKGDHYRCKVESGQLSLLVLGDGRPPVNVEVFGKTESIDRGTWAVLSYQSNDQAQRDVGSAAKKTADGSIAA